MLCDMLLAQLLVKCIAPLKNRSTFQNLKLKIVFQDSDSGTDFNPKVSILLSICISSSSTFVEDHSYVMHLMHLKGTVCFY